MSQDFLWDFDNSYQSLPDTFYAFVHTSAVEQPEMVLFNKGLAIELGVSELERDLEQTTRILSGNEKPQETETIAQAYGGHQFGHFNVLGDGRAILLGEIITPQEERVDIQLKGAGRTPYSRNGDGRATLYSMLREYLISEAMHALNIPTTRSLAVVKSNTPVYRQKAHNSGILTRVAESHIRVGTFELAARMGDPEKLKTLLKYTINRHFPEIAEDENPALSFLKAVMKLQIKLVNDWLRVGFIHGVMNTDNVSIAGETIDYGPCAFMNSYDERTVFSSIDQHSRYAYGNQSKVIKWNLMRLAETILPLIDEDEKKSVPLAQAEFDKFEDQFYQKWKINHLAKLGIIKEEDGDEQLLHELMDWMQQKQPDFTNTFRGLTDPELHQSPVYQDEAFVNWKKKWLNRISSVDLYENLLESYNPSVIPRNHIVEEVLIEASENNNFQPFLDFHQALSNPYNNPSSEYYQTPPSTDEGYQTFCGT